MRSRGESSSSVGRPTKWARVDYGTTCSLCKTIGHRKSHCLQSGGLSEEAIALRLEGRKASVNSEGVSYVVPHAGKESTHMLTTPIRKETVTQTSPMVQQKADTATGTDEIVIASEDGGNDAGAHHAEGKAEGEDVYESFHADPDAGNEFSMINGMEGYAMRRDDPSGGDEDGSPSSFVWNGQSAGKGRAASGAGREGQGGARAGSAAGGGSSKTMTGSSGYKQILSPKRANAGPGPGKGGGRPATDDADAGTRERKKSKDPEGGRRGSRFIPAREQMEPTLSMGDLQKQAKEGDKDADTLLKRPSGQELKNMVMHHNVISNQSLVPQALFYPFSQFRGKLLTVWCLNVCRITTITTMT